jgi:hypothetical protein
MIVLIYHDLAWFAGFSRSYQCLTWGLEGKLDSKPEILPGKSWWTVEKFCSSSLHQYDFTFGCDPVRNWATPATFSRAGWLPTVIIC